MFETPLHTSVQWQFHGMDWHIFGGKTALKSFMIRAYEGHSPGSKLLPRRRFPGNFIFNSGKTFFICRQSTMLIIILHNSYHEIKQKLYSVKTAFITETVRSLIMNQTLRVKHVYI